MDIRHLACTHAYSPGPFETNAKAFPSLDTKSTFGFTASIAAQQSLHWHAQLAACHFPVTS